MISAKIKMRQQGLRLQEHSLPVQFRNWTVGISVTDITSVASQTAVCRRRIAESMSGPMYNAKLFQCIPREIEEPCMPRLLSALIFCAALPLALFAQNFAAPSKADTSQEALVFDRMD